MHHGRMLILAAEEVSFIFPPPSSTLLPHKHIREGLLVKVLLIGNGCFFLNPLWPPGIRMREALFFAQIQDVCRKHDQLIHVEPRIGAQSQRAIGAEDHLFHREHGRYRVHPDEGDDEIAHDIGFLFLE